MRISALVAAAALGTLSVGCGKSISIKVQDPNPTSSPNAAVAPTTTANQNSAIAAKAPAPATKDAGAPSPVAPTTTADAATNDATTNANHYFVQNQNGAAITIFAENSSGSAVLGTVPNGTQVLMHLSDRSGEWLEISAPGNIRGWAAATDLVDRDGNTASPSLSNTAQRLSNSTKANTQATSNNHQTYQVKTMDGTGLNLRAQPQLDGKVMTMIADGAMVTAVGTVGEWTEVIAQNGQRGYVVSNYLVTR